MRARTLAWVAAATRVGIGASIAVYPRGAAVWAGDGVGRPGNAMLARGLGVRDLLLGLGQLSALARGTPLQPWLAFGAAVGVADAAATASAAPDLPASARVLLPVIAATALVDVYVATRAPSDLE